MVHNLGIEASKNNVSNLTITRITLCELTCSKYVVFSIYLAKICRPIKLYDMKITMCCKLLIRVMMHFTHICRPNKLYNSYSLAHEASQLLIKNQIQHVKWKLEKNLPGKFWTNKFNHVMLLGLHFLHWCDKQEGIFPDIEQLYTRLPELQFSANSRAVNNKLCLR